MGKLPLHTPFEERSAGLMKWTMLAVAAVSLAVYTWLPLRECHRMISSIVKADKHIVEDVCAQPEPAGSLSTYSESYSSQEFLEDSAMKLSGAVKIPTMTYDDMGPPDSDPRWAPFKDLHEYLVKTYPTIHKEANLSVVGGYSLIYTFKGSKPSLKPLMLTAHQDVVPAVTSLDRWTYPPFDGVIDGDWLYGRGSSDCKNNLIALMTAVEHMLDNGWKPTRTLILAFGQDEEITGLGAQHIDEHLKKVYGENGIGVIVDEGGMGIDTQYGVQFALPAIAEKGYTDAFIEVDMLGGHSSVPSRYTTIGILSKIVSAIEDSDAFQPHMEKASPLWGYLSCIAQHGGKDKVPSWITDAVSSKNPDMKAIAQKFAETTPQNRYTIQTSKVATLFNAGIKVNALAESAVATFNTRIDIFSSVKEVQSTYLSLIEPIAKAYSLQLNGTSFSSESPIGNISVTWGEDSNDPTSIAPFTLESTAWGVFARAVQASFGSDVVSAPSLMTGNTDTRYYLNLTKNIYRWSPSRVGTKLNAHTVDEKILISGHVEGIRFFTELIMQVDDDSLEL